MSNRRAIEFHWLSVLTLCLLWRRLPVRITHPPESLSTKISQTIAPARTDAIGHRTLRARRTANGVKSSQNPGLHIRKRACLHWGTFQGSVVKVGRYDRISVLRIEFPSVPISIHGSPDLALLDPPRSLNPLFMSPRYPHRRRSRDPLVNSTAVWFPPTCNTKVAHSDT